MQFFDETLAKMKHIFKISPQAVAHDLHPDYRSTRMALASGIERKFATQHHHAHIASCMAENRLSGKVIGVAMDGTGLGTDGTVWGGEFLVVDLASFDVAAEDDFVDGSGAVGGDGDVVLDDAYAGCGDEDLVALAAVDDLGIAGNELHTGLRGGGSHAFSASLKARSTEVREAVPHQHTEPTHA